MKIQTRDVIAAGILVALFACKIMGMNGLIDASIALIVGYYFSKRVYEETECQKNKQPQP